jgi:hypothetical protein
MAYLTAVAYVAAYFTLVVGFIVLNAGYNGQSDVLDISSWQDCRKFIKRGWMTFGSSYLLIGLAIALNQIYAVEQWGWIYVSVVIYFMGVFIGPLMVMDGKRNNPHVPS